MPAMPMSRDCVASGELSCDPATPISAFWVCEMTDDEAIR